MDCVDCHNRPTHAFDLPENAVDKQMSLGRISPELPYIRKKAVEVLKVNYPDPRCGRAVASKKKSTISIRPITRQSTRRGARWWSKLATEVARIYLRNVFPDMRVTWGTHPNNLGHNDSPGCFRCHDGSHTSADGQTITNDCSRATTFWQSGEENPKVLTDLGMK